MQAPGGQRDAPGGLWRLEEPVPGLTISLPLFSLPQSILLRPLLAQCPRRLLLFRSHILREGGHREGIGLSTVGTGTASHGAGAP